MRSLKAPDREETKFDVLEDATERQKSIAQQLNYVVRVV